MNIPPEPIRSEAAPGAGRARTRVRPLWQPGDLFHIFSRYPRKRGAPKVDRLASILRNGIVAPASCSNGSVCPDLSLVVTGMDVPYTSWVFLHYWGPLSEIYLPWEPGRIVVLVDSTLPVLQPEQMPEPWVILCQDEVYVRDRVPVERLTGVAVHPDDAAGVKADCKADLERLGIPLYSLDGTVVWPESR